MYIAIIDSSTRKVHKKEREREREREREGGREEGRKCEREEREGGERVMSTVEKLPPLSPIDPKVILCGEFILAIHFVDDLFHLIRGAEAVS